MTDETQSAAPRPRLAPIEGDVVARVDAGTRELLLAVAPTDAANRPPSLNVYLEFPAGAGHFDRRFVVALRSRKARRFLEQLGAAVKQLETLDAASSADRLRMQSSHAQPVAAAPVRAREADVLEATGHRTTPGSPPPGYVAAMQPSRRREP